MNAALRRRTLPALVTVVALALLGWALWTAWDVRRAMPEARTQALAVHQLVGEVERLDEALTAAVRLAAVTGEARWAARYGELEREITGVIDSLTAVAAPIRAQRPAEPPQPGAGPGTLPALEAEALSLVEAGDRAAAVALLESERYAAAKAAFDVRKARLLSDARAVVAEADLRTDERMAWLVAAAAASMVLLLVAWGWIVGARGQREQLRLESALRRSEERLRAVMDVAPVAIIRVDRAYCVQFWNPAAERIFGWTAEEVLGRPYPLGDPGDRDEAKDLFDRGFGGHTHEGVEIRRLRKDGSHVDLRMWNAIVRDESGEAVALVGVLADVTEQRALEQRLLQSQKLEAVGQLAGGIAHDFNNVLTAVRGHAELLLEGTPAGAAGRQDLEEIRRNADRATRLTRQLLAFSRQQVLQPRVVDLGAVVDGMESMLRRLIGEHIRLELSVEEGLGRVEADPTQIEQVVLNLAVNGRDAMPEGGRLLLRLENTELTDEDARSFPYEVLSGRYVRLMVADTGHGMDEETRGRVFEPFFTTKGLSHGTGLGLATVFGIVKQSGGYIWVHSEPGRGSDFEVLLPRVEKAMPLAAPPRHAGQAGMGGSETVLLVEDDEAVRGLAHRVLERSGYHVLEAAHPTEALRTVLPAHEGPIHLLVTDIVMPDMDGHRLAEHVAALYPDIRTIFMSGYTEDEVVRRGIVNGASLFLQKPFGPHDLTRSVREMLDRDVVEHGSAP
ncbi:MAG: response regulator [Gemmatimonadetes bacterium]|nr:response regulator [Gemmatimonadota bacterium]